MTESDFHSIRTAAPVLPEDVAEPLRLVWVDDEPMGRLRLRTVCEKVRPPEGRHGERPIALFECADLDEVREVLAGHSRVHVLLLDKDMSRAARGPANGIALIPEFLKLQPQLRILMVTGSDDRRDIVAAMAAGAANYLTKDESTSVLVAAIERALVDSLTSIEAIEARLDRLSIYGRQTPTPSPADSSRPLSLQELMSRPLNVVDEQFARLGGVKALRSLLETKLIEDVSTKAVRKKDQARLLGLSPYQYSRFLAQHGSGKPPAAGRADVQRSSTHE